jgi:hypothetical protein
MTFPPAAAVFPPHLTEAGRRTVPENDRVCSRANAAGLAVRLLANPNQAPTQEQARSWMDFFFGYLIAPETTSLNATLAVKDATGHTITTLTSTDGGTMSTAMTIDDTVTVAIATEDDHGDATSDTLTITTSDNGSVVTWVQDGNTFTGTPAAEGESVLTVSDPSAPSVSPFVADLTVGAGATSQIAGTVTVNTGANPAPPASS